MNVLWGDTAVRFSERLNIFQYGNDVRKCDE